jgi:cell division septal protein FtsQ
MRPLSDPEQKIPLRKALLYVFLSVCLIWGISCLVWWYRSWRLQEQRLNPLYSITTIIQTCSRHPLQTWQLAELLDLSHDERTNLYFFDTALGKERVLACPVIKKAQVRKMRPGIVHIDYETREPKALIADYENMACDEEGFIFPLFPYFSPKLLPEVYLGSKATDDEIAWNRVLRSEKLDLAFAAIDFVSNHFPVDLRLVRVDVHKAFALSAGEREMVLLLEKDGQRCFVRLHRQGFERNLRLLLQLQPELEKMSHIVEIVDLRSPGIVLVK